MQPAIFNRDPGDEDPDTAHDHYYGDPHTWDSEPPDPHAGETGYEEWDPKHPDHHSNYADIYDLRDPFQGRD